MRIQRFALILIVLSLLLSLNLHGATYFVLSGASGNGTSWANAWGSPSSISWSSLNPGDTVCIAGGTYSTGISTTKSGNSSNPITLHRATASDSVCGSTTSGWSSSYDGQVIINGGNIEIGSNYITIDGMVANGIQVVMPNPSGSYFVGIAGDVGPTSNVTLRNIEVAGPCPNGTLCEQNNDHRSLEIEHWNGSSYDTQSNWLVQSVNLHGACNNMVIYGAQNMIIENSRLADSLSTNGNYCHPNVGNIGASTVTFRWNEVVDWDTEGLMFLDSATWYVYGNIWHDPSTSSYPRVMESQISNALVYFYNNTLVNIPYATVDTANGGTWSSNSQGRNNIYWNTNGAGGLASDDYDYSDKSLSETHGEGNAANIFVNYSAGTVAGYHITQHTNAGLNLGAPYNVDYDGNTRVNWDRGALEFDGSAAPSPPTGLTAAVQ